MDGILNINKPPHKTSFSIVSRIKQLTGERRVGHAGTLDPAATGVLPVCLGQGTRVVEFLQNTSKIYQAEILLGVATDTYDATGSITQKGDYSNITQEQLEAELNTFIGSVSQIPPMYSAVKHHGQRLYELARAGITVERKSRLTQIYRVELLEWQPPVASIIVECGKGTYIRSLAHDLGQSLGCGAHLKSLVRLKYGPFHISSAISLSQFEDAVRHGYWQHFVHPLDTVLLHWAAVIVSDEASQAVRNGQPLILSNGCPETDRSGSASADSLCRAYSRNGCFLGVLRYNPSKGHWQPEKIFARSPAGV